MNYTSADTPLKAPSSSDTAPSLSSLSTPSSSYKGLDDVSPDEWDRVTRPRHYKKTPEAVECIHAIKSSMSPEQFRGYLKGNVEKYVWRCEDHPNGEKESLQKAAVYLKWLIEVTND